MTSSRSIMFVTVIGAISFAGSALAMPTLGSLRINSGSGQTSASNHWYNQYPVEPPDYWDTRSMPWAPGFAGANCTNGPAWADLSVSFWDLTWDAFGGWTKFGDPGTITGSASVEVPNQSGARSWADISFTNVSAFLFSARVTGHASISLRGDASFDIVNGQSLDVWLSPGNYSISLDAGAGGSFFAAIPAPGALTLAAAGALCGSRRRRMVN
ncbi:MAG: hypothetical protein U0573_00660 [Phycisphaerales bacterium]|nr:hypothetical protein [Planctomycetota bacterium]